MTQYSRPTKWGSGVRLSAGAAATMLVIACGGAEGADDSAETSDLNAELQVFAAASLTETFTEIGERFEAEHGVPVVFNFAGSSDLVSQITQGAPADVFASADEANMDRAVEDDALAAEPELFAANTLVIVTPPQNPADVQSLEDLADEDSVVVVCAAQVPCGSATEEVTGAAGIELSPASEESAVTDVLGKVRAGEADAGLVYRTDAQGAGEDVETIEFDGADEVVNLYPIAPVNEASDPQAAEDFVEFAMSEESQQILSDAGFSSP